MVGEVREEDIQQEASFSPDEALRSFVLEHSNQIMAIQLFGGDLLGTNNRKELEHDLARYGEKSRRERLMSHIRQMRKGKDELVDSTTVNNPHIRRRILASPASQWISYDPKGYARSILDTTHAVIYLSDRPSESGPAFFVSNQDEPELFSPIASVEAANVGWTEKDIPPEDRALVVPADRGNRMMIYVPEFSRYMHPFGDGRTIDPDTVMQVIKEHEDVLQHPWSSVQYVADGMIAHISNLSEPQDLEVTYLAADPVFARSTPDPAGFLQRAIRFMVPEINVD